MSTASHGLFHMLSHAFAGSALLLLLGCFVVSRLAPTTRARLVAHIQQPSTALAAAAVLLALYLLTALAVLTFPGYVDPVEPYIVAASFFSVHRMPVYAWPIPYGPYCFLPYGLAMQLFGAGVTTLKAAVLLGNALFLALLFAIFRKRLALPATLLTLGLILAALLMKQSYLLQARGDLLIFIAVALALLAPLTRRPALAFVLITLALALGIGVKITTVLYLLYPLALEWKRRGPKLLLAAAFAAAVLNFLPFLSPTFSLHSYAFWLHGMSAQPRSSKELAGDFFTSAVLVLPCALLFAQLFLRNRDRARLYLRDQALPLGLLLLSTLVMDILAGKFGGGRHHLAPFVPAFAFLAVDVYLTLRSAPALPSAPRLTPVPLLYLWACFGALLLLGAAGELADMHRLTARERPQALALQVDLRQTLARFPGRTVELGEGAGETDLEQNYSPLYAAPEVLAAGGAYHYDPSAVADLELMRLPFTPAELAALRDCQHPTFLIPHGEHPFHAVSIYSVMYPHAYPEHQLFPPAFQQAFHDTYQLDSETPFFDIYTCHPPRNR